MGQAASTGLDHALVVACGLTQILAEGSSCRWSHDIYMEPDPFTK